jgi:hypothetical protein
MTSATDNELNNVPTEPMSDEELDKANAGGFYKWTSVKKMIYRIGMNACPSCGRADEWKKVIWDYQTLFRTKTRVAHYCDACGYGREAAFKAPTSSFWF